MNCRTAHIAVKDCIGVNNMGLTEYHWFEDDERELTEWQLEKSIADLDKAYKKVMQMGIKMEL